MSDVRRRSIFALALAAATVIVPSAPGLAVQIPPLTPSLTFDVVATVSPQKLPRRRPAPVAFHLSGKVATADGTHPSALREMAINADRSVVLDATGLPACGRGQLLALTVQQARRDCRRALLGRGKADLDVGAAGSRPVRTPIALFNSGEKNGVATMLAKAELDRQSLIATVKVDEAGGDGHGLKAVVEIPRIEEGMGSLLDFEVTIGRLFKRDGKTASYLSARCPIDHLDLVFPKVLFKNEAHEPGIAPSTVMSGSKAIPCTPLG